MKQAKAINDSQNHMNYNINQIKDNQSPQSVTITITLKAGAGKPEICIHPQKKEGEFMADWFDRIETVASDAPMEYSEKHYSVCDTLDVITANDRAFRILVDAVYSMSDMRMTKSLAAMMGGKTLVELASALESTDIPGAGKKAPENALQIINAELKKIAKK